MFVIDKKVKYIFYNDGKQNKHNHTIARSDTLDKNNQTYFLNSFTWDKREQRVRIVDSNNVVLRKTDTKFPS